MKFLLDNKIFKGIDYYLNNPNKYTTKKNKNSKIECNYVPPCKIELKKSKSKIIVIGDIHGDLYTLLHALYKASVINIYGKWIGGDTYVVQLGDQLDKGGRRMISVDNTMDEIEELKVIEYMHHLHFEAKKNGGGGVFNLIGNHELMNLMGDFRYATQQHIRGFGGEIQRKKLFEPGGPLAKKLACNTNGVMRIGNWIFVHAGLLPKHIENYSIESINNIVRNILLGNLTMDNIDPNIESLIFGKDSLFWNRFYSKDNESGNDKCNILNKTIDLLHLGNKGGMVVGHTVKDNITSICNNKLWMADVGMSSAFGNKKNHKERVEILIIHNNGERFETI